MPGLLCPPPHNRSGKQRWPVTAWLWLALCAAPQLPAAETPTAPKAVVQAIDTGYYSRALRLLLPLLKLSPEAPELRLCEAQILLGLDRPLEARERLLSLQASGFTSATLHRLLGETFGAEAARVGPLHAFGLARKTLHEFELAVATDPNDVPARVNLALFYAQAPMLVGGSLEKAHAEELEIERHSRLLALQTRATEAEVHRKYPVAEQHLKAALMLDPSADTLMQLGLMYRAAGQLPDALRCFAEARAHAREPVAARYWFARSAAEARLRLAEAIEPLQRYIALPERPDKAPSLAWAQLTLADLHSQLGQLDAARSALAAAAVLARRDDAAFADAYRNISPRLAR